MSEHRATIRWEYSGSDFVKGRYSREHVWVFDGGITVNASPSPSVVPAPYSNPANVDPEEAFVAAVASCHMLTYLFVAARAGFAIERYTDDAVGVMTKNELGIFWVSKVTLRPNIAYVGSQSPTPAQVQQLHHQAHDRCYIANSIKTEVVVED
ncbi:MAG: OsmC family peroxiredoxin [Gammaproteobacteria bacterium]|nr:OsmC family peroxiredoxin [Gammaproteobacteria bacterium]